MTLDELIEWFMKALLTIAALILGFFLYLGVDRFLHWF